MWDQDPFSRGSYSYIPFGAHGALYDVMAQSEWENSLFFAGESTYREHAGTVDGAYSSGVREAGKISRSLKEYAKTKK
jgi:lysine-specific histone demethylase 1